MSHTCIMAKPPSTLPYVQALGDPRSPAARESLEIPRIQPLLLYF